MPQAFPSYDAERERLACLQRLCVLDTPPDSALDRITLLASKLLRSPIAVISLVDETRQWFKARVGLPRGETPRDHSFCSQAILSSAPMIVQDAMEDDRFRTNPLVLGEPFIRFYAGVPLRTESGLNVGTLCVMDTKPRSGLSGEELEVLTDLAGLAMARLDSLRSIRFVDPLTRLPNQHKLLDDVERVARAPSHAADPPLLWGIEVISTNHLQDITKALGTRYAERLILEARNRIQAVLPADAMLYYIGPATFAGVHRVGCRDLVRSVLAAFNTAVECDGIPVVPRCATGWVGIGSGDDAGQLLRSLLLTLGNAREKELEWALYDPAIDAKQQRAFQILAALPGALRLQGQLALFYQPRIDLVTGALAGVEALLRWNHPTLGPISPAEFIPLAEKTALIGGVTDWVVDHALMQAAIWRRDGYRFRVSINVSAHDIEREHFADSFAAKLNAASVPAGAIELEFTENAVMRDVAQVHAQLSQLRDLGVEVAIDDFGTGHCNVSYLKSIPASVLKLDQTFIRKLSQNETDRTIVRSMIALAHTLGYKVVAEGIETQASYDLLEQWSCDEGQGYFLARPMDAKTLAEWIDSSQTRQPTPRSSFD